MVKIEVCPTLALETSHIFKDSQGNRQTLNPAETLEDVEKTAQEFDGSDPLVAKMIISQLTLKPPAVKVSTADKKILYAALDALDRVDTASKKNAKGIEHAVAEAEKQSAEALDAAVKEAVKDALEASRIAFWKRHDEIQAEVGKEQKKALDKAVKDAVAEAEKQSAEALDKAVKDAVAEAEKKGKSK